MHYFYNKDTSKYLKLSFHSHFPHRSVEWLSLKELNYFAGIGQNAPFFLRLPRGSPP